MGTGMRPADVDQEIERQLRDAHAAGVREGEAAGRARAAGEVRPVIEKLALGIQDLAGWRARLRREAEADLIRLALAIARRILNRELAIDPDALHALVVGALEKLQGQEILRVHVHPAHAALLTSCMQPARARGVEVIAEPGCEPGTLILETERGNLDASVQSQLTEIERGLTDRLRSSR